MVVVVVVVAVAGVVVGSYCVFLFIHIDCWLVLVCAGSYLMSLLKRLLLRI